MYRHRHPIIVLSLCLCFSGLEAQDIPFVRGDANFDGNYDLADAITTLGYIFQGTARPVCLDAVDSNDDGDLDVSDAIFSLSFLFTGGRRPDPPYPDAGADPTPDPLDCSGVGEPIVLRHGNFVTVQHGVSGRVEHLSDNTIRLVGFDYDGGGLPEVIVWLHLIRGSERDGWGISEDLRGTSFVDAELVYPIPEGITGEMFGYVSIWCTSFPANYGYARLFIGP